MGTLLGFKAGERCCSIQTGFERGRIAAQAGACQVPVELETHWRGQCQTGKSCCGAASAAGGALVWSSPVLSPPRMRRSRWFGSRHTSIMVSILLRWTSPMQGTRHCPSDRRWPFAAMSPGALGCCTEGLRLRGSLEATTCPQYHPPRRHRPRLGHILCVTLGKGENFCSKGSMCLPSCSRMHLGSWKGLGRVFWWGTAFWRGQPCVGGSAQGSPSTELEPLHLPAPYEDGAHHPTRPFSRGGNWGPGKHQ